MISVTGALLKYMKGRLHGVRICRVRKRHNTPVLVLYYSDFSNIMSMYGATPAIGGRRAILGASLLLLFL